MIGELATWYLFLAGAGAGAIMVTAVLEALTPFDARCFAPVALTRGGSDWYAAAGSTLPVAGYGEDADERVATAGYRSGVAAWTVAPSGETVSRLTIAPTRFARLAALPVIPRPNFQRFFGPAYGVGLIAVAVGMLCLLADLGRPDRIFQLLLNPTLSFISVGVYLLLILSLATVLLCVVWVLGATRLPRWLVATARIVGFVAAIAVMTYTGLLLSSMPSIPFWHTAWVPLLFVLSDVSTGVGLVVAAVLLTGGDGLFRTTFARIKRWDVLAIGAQTLCLVFLLGTAVFRGSVAQASATMLLSGSVAPQFWIMVVGMGILFPLLAQRLGRFGSQRMMLAVSTALLISCFFLRWCIVQVGMAPDMAAAVMAALGSG